MLDEFIKLVDFEIGSNLDRVRSVTELIVLFFCVTVSFLIIERIYFPLLLMRIWEAWFFVSLRASKDYCFSIYFINRDFNLLLIYT